MQALLAPYTITLRDLEELGLPVVEENGDTFAANALLKAQAAARAAGMLALADDSGLEVDALGGAPGVHSARWAGDVDAPTRNTLLLQRLAGVPDAARGARFVSVIAVAGPEGAVGLARGELAGRIAEAPRGAHGFGYDPIFLLPASGRTFAELAPEEKNAVSHRAQALAGALALLRYLAGV